MRNVDLIVLFGYLAVVASVGLSRAGRSRTVAGFTTAGGSLAAWVVGLSLFGTFLSSNSFIGIPGKAYAADWSSFVFSLSLLPAAYLAARYFVPFYREGGSTSAYTHLEQRFGRWARSYAAVFYLLTQLARVGSILLGVAIAVATLTGWSVATIIVAVGVVVTLYTLLGGIEAVIWTDVIQCIVLSLGAVFVAVLVVLGVPGGVAGIVGEATAAGKFSLGGFGASLAQPTFWVVLAYGFLINLNNFGIDQSYVQRYHVARNPREASSSVWLAAFLYVPVSGLFFWIGTSLFIYYGEHADRLAPLSSEVAADQVADRVFPHFIATELPLGLAGLLVAAIFAAAMSSIDTSLNSSATIVLTDFVRSDERGLSEAAGLRVLRLATIGFGIVGTTTALVMIGVSSLLDAWWTLSGIFAGGMLGLFLLSILVRRATSTAAAIATTCGVVVILSLSLPALVEQLGTTAPYTVPFHSNLTIVAGTATIVLVGALVASRRKAAA